VKAGDLVRPIGLRSSRGNDPRVLGVLVDKHSFYPECWNVYWNYSDREDGIGIAYEASLGVYDEDR